MPSLLKRVTVLLLTTFTTVAAPPSNVCKSHKVLSDPWRNLGFLLEQPRTRSNDDCNLEEGWYSLTGIGGDRLVSSCRNIRELSLVNSSMPCDSSETFLIYNCNSMYSLCSITEQFTQTLDCGGGKVIYYLVPTKGIYGTRHSSCSATSCGVHAHCELGNCVCDSGFSVPHDFLPTGDLYGCSDLNSTIHKKCQVDLTVECTTDLLTEILNSKAEELPQEIVERYLNTIMYLTAGVINDSMDQNDLKFYGNVLFDANEKLVSTLVRKTDTCSNVSFSVQNLEVRVLTVGPNANFTESLQFITSNVSLDIDLIGIASNNNGSAAVVFMSYTNMEHVLKPSFFNTTASTIKTTMMSTIVSVTLPKTTNTHLSNPVNFTFQHIDELHSEGVLSCVHWKINAWEEDGCTITEKNGTHTMCSCDHLSTFALIIKTDSCMTVFQMYSTLGLAIEVAMDLEIIFLALSILTLLLCCRNPKLTNTALINLCINLLLWEFFNLITEKYLCSIYLYQKLCAFLAGLRHLFGLSAFMWMLNEAVLLFFFVKNLSNISSNRGEGLNWKWLMLIGYIIPLVVVGVSAVVFPHGYVNEICWVNFDSGLLYTFEYLIYFIIALNAFLYIVIVVVLTITLIRMKNENLQRSNTNDAKLIISVMLKSLAQFFVLGCSWIINFTPNIDEMVAFVVLFISLQQGVFIFLVHCLLNQEVREQYRKFLCAALKSLMPQRILSELTGWFQ